MGETVLPKIEIILIETKQSNKTKRSVFKIAFTVSGKIGICFKTSVKQERERDKALQKAEGVGEMAQMSSQEGGRRRLEGVGQTAGQLCEKCPSHSKANKSHSLPQQDG